MRARGVSKLFFETFRFPGLLPCVLLCSALPPSSSLNNAALGELGLPVLAHVALCERNASRLDDHESPSQLIREQECG